MEGAEYPGVITNLIFVYAYHNLPGISEREWVEYYPCNALRSICEAVTAEVSEQLDLFANSADYAGYFAGAEYGNPEDSISADEIAIFRSALSKGDRNTPFEELHPLDVLDGFRSVILKRIDKATLADIRDGLQLFDFIFECALAASGRSNPGSTVSVEPAEEFGRWFVDSLIRSIETRDTVRAGYAGFIADKFEPLKPLLEMLRPMVRHEGWPHSDLALGRLLLIVDYFKRVVEDEWTF